MSAAPPRRAARTPAARANGDARHNSGAVLITGGAGFLGSNLADRLAGEGRTVMIFDSLARPNVEKNLAWLQQRHGSRIVVRVGDVRDQAALRAAVASSEQIFHLAAQVAVTTSLIDPVTDFEVNARGTLNLLEAIRAQANPPPLVFASTNKVYGNLEALDVAERATRYEPLDERVVHHGIEERQPLALYSPYGCSKGAADQYVLDYARIFGIPALVFRMSCLYGPRQFGTEDQGWVAHFAISALRGAPITIYGDGKQVRDVLFVGDVVEALVLAQRHMKPLAGQAFNIGGGSDNAISLLELLALLRKIHGRLPPVRHGPARAGDQLFYVSDTRKFGAATGWRPSTAVRTGLERLVEWLETWKAKPFARETERVTA